jgi:hypothetical protein
MTNPDASRKEFEAWIVKTHTDNARSRGMMETREHEELIERVNKNLVRKFKSVDEYQDDEIQSQWEAWQAARNSDKGEAVGEVIDVENQDGYMHRDCELLEAGWQLPVGTKLFTAPQQAIPADRFYQEHGMWHDRETGQHMYTQDEYDQLRRDAFHNGYVSADNLSELERALCVIGVVGKIDGYDVIRRESVISVARDRLTKSAAPTAPIDNVREEVEMGCRDCADNFGTCPNTGLPCGT